MHLARMIRIAWRNVLRNKRRSAITILILVLGGSGLVLVGGFFDSLIHQFQEYYVRGYSGHFQVNRAGYFEKGTIDPLDYLMREGGRVQGVLESEKGVRTVAPRLNFGGLLGSDESSVSVIALGVDPRLEREMAGYVYPGSRSRAAMLTEGRDLDASDPYGIVVGEGLMKALGLKVGGPVNLIVTREAGSIDGARFVVRGSFRTTLKEVGDRLVKINLDAAQKLLGVPGGVHSLLVIMQDGQDIGTAIARLESRFRSAGLDLETIPWEKSAEFYRQSRGFLEHVYRIVKAIIGVIFLLSIANTIHMALLERTREYGTMRAIGNGRARVFGLILIEAAILGAAGGGLGALVGLTAAKLISGLQLQMPPPPGASTSLGSITVLFLVGPRLLTETFVVGFAAALLSSLVPAWRVSRCSIVRALGYV